MKVLEVHRDECWSLQAENSAGVEALRSILERGDAKQKDALTRIRWGKAYRFTGNPADLDLASSFFDEIHVRYRPEASQEARLRIQVRRWLKAGGLSKFPEVRRNRADHKARETAAPGARRFFPAWRTREAV